MWGLKKDLAAGFDFSKGGEERRGEEMCIQKQ